MRRLHPMLGRPTRVVLVLLFLAAAGMASWTAADEPERFDPKLPRAKPITPPTAEAIDEAIVRGIDFLVARQEKNGAWGSAQRTKSYNIYAPAPGAHHAFRAAVTSLCISALIESGDSRPEVVAAIDRAEAWLFEHLPSVRRANADALYNTWGHAYSIRALVRMHGRHADDPDKQKRIKELIEQQIDMLERYECVDGGWLYYDMVAYTKQPSGSSMSFVTATVLVALAEARDLGIGIDIAPKSIEKAVESLRRQRLGDFSYLYGEYLKMQPARYINRSAGSIGRSQACNLAMYLWKDEKTTLPVVRTWLDRLFVQQMWFDVARKRPIAHESWMQISGYFYYYGHFYAAGCIELLPPEERPYFQQHLAHIILPLQEKDGSWWDYPFYDYHQQYGTAYALMTLLRCRPEKTAE
ncbi:MAG: hypothetical protein GX621_18465, partial [Pirellulaceae bacterium]|nr:hypothetical protein [Pirellulaceae bacterium]